MKKFFQIFFAAVIFFVGSTAFANDSYIEAEGVIYPEPGQSLNQMRRSSILDAYRYLAEQVDDLYISSTSTVQQARLEDDEINSKVQTVLRGAKIVKVSRDLDGSFHAIVRLPIYGANQSLASAVLNQNISVEDFPKPKFTNIVSKNYSGLVIDCRDFNFSNAITPKIISVGGVEIYGYKNLGYKNVVENGMVEYANNFSSPRAGNSPLVVKAVKISGACDILVSDDDANKILAANQSDNFLGNCAVVIVR